MSDSCSIGFRRCFFGVFVACLATTALAQISARGDEPSAPEARHSHHRLPPIAPLIVVPVTPNEGSLPSTYVPDDYRLPGYDGKPDGPHTCNGRTGRSWSTDGRKCPPGQHPETGGRSYSTSP
ncbi:MAG: hypothetical protein PF501_11320 [Salinisphaera sp.]|jgi:hypothetical protein|nr:hypothetical protein [Salinisphaera sp.]